jgi:hypothetical protein
MQKRFFFFFFLLPCFSLAQPFDFVQKIEGTETEIITDLVFTKQQDYAVCGGYADVGGANFQATNGKNTVILPHQDTFKQGYSTVFLAKYNKKGEVKWVVNALAEDGIHAWDLACDSLGNLIVCGNFRGRVKFNSTDKRKTKIFNGLPKTSLGMGLEFPLNSFVAKYDKKGVLLWVKIGLSPNHSAAMQAETDAQNNIYLRFYCHSNAISFEKYSVLPATKTYLQAYQCIVMKCLPSGEEEWIMYGGSPSSTMFVRNMHLNTSGNVVLELSVYSKLIFYNTSGAVFQQHLEHNYNTYHVNLDKAGLVTRIDTLPSLTNNEAGFPNIKKTVANLQGERYMILMAEDLKYTGKRTLIWNGKTIVAQQKDIFLAKADAQNRPLWLIQLATQHDELALDIALDKRGNVLISGWFWNEMTIKGCIGDSLKLNSDKMIALFVASFSEKGELNWAQNCGKSWGLWRNEPCLKLAVSPENKLLLYGQIDTPTALGQHQLNVLGELQTTTPVSEYAQLMFRYPDAFIAQIDLRKMPDNSPKTPNRVVADAQKNTILNTENTASNIDNVVQENPNTAILYPNPITQTSGIVNIDLNTVEAYVAVFRIVNSSGVLLSQTTENLPKGFSHIQRSFADYPPGVYLLTIQLGKTQLVKRVVLI